MKHLALALSLAAVMPRPVLAGRDLPSPICARPAVLEQLAFELRRAGRRLLLETAAVGEVSTGSLVHCALRTHATAFDTDHYGPQPLDTVGIVRYALEQRRNGIFLRLE